MQGLCNNTKPTLQVISHTRAHARGATDLELACADFQIIACCHNCKCNLSSKGKNSVHTTSSSAKGSIIISDPTKVALTYYSYAYNLSGRRNLCDLWFLSYVIFRFVLLALLPVLFPAN